jgi:uncharacterized protein (TIGR03000 family)
MKRWLSIWTVAAGCGLLSWSEPAAAQSFSFSYGGGHYRHPGGYYPGSYYPGYGRGYDYYPGYGAYDGYYGRRAYRDPYGSRYAQPGYHSHSYPRYSEPVYVDPLYAAGRASARIDVRLPDRQGDVWFDGRKTDGIGARRSFATPPLPPGTYTYSISAAWHQGGRLVTEERTVTVRPGTSTLVDFTQPLFLPSPTRVE